MAGHPPAEDLKRTCIALRNHSIELRQKSQRLVALSDEIRRSQPKLTISTSPAPASRA
jgi:hypothetical protein